jgi:amino acid transporter
MSSFFKQAFQRKMLSSDGSDAQTATQDALLKKSLGLFDLIGFGIAAIIGAGIFSTIGTASYQGGPAVILLFLSAAVVCAFSGLAYAEFASMVKGSGSSYTYTAISLGELPAWLIGWAIIAEYALICIVVSISWSSYLVGFLDGVGVIIPEYLRVSYTTAQTAMQEITKFTNEGTADSLAKITDVMKHQQQAWDTAPMLAGFRFIINLPAIVIVTLLSALAYRGIHESKTVSHAMVAVKLGVIALILLVGTGYINTENYTPFMPNGFGGLTQSISAVFFAYIGFDVITATAAECKNPQKDLPRGILWSIGICTLLYILIALLVTGMVSYKELNHGDPLAFVFDQLAQKEGSVLLQKFSQIIALSALCATTSVILVFQLGQQ